jgi:ElaB/YqjD/DUF883 family membrane-anchored ribosome-binding protein
MTRLEQSQKRLAEAVQRLEAVLAESGGPQGAAARELAAVREAYEDLKRTADAVADRLDRAIARVDLLLGEADARDAAE